MVGTQSYFGHLVLAELSPLVSPVTALLCVCARQLLQLMPIENCSSKHNRSTMVSVVIGPTAAIVPTVVGKLATVPRRLIDCNFTESTCNWIHDPNNWPSNWYLTSEQQQQRPSQFRQELPTWKAICLDLVSSVPASTEVPVLTARLFGPLVSAAQAPSCLRLRYKLEHNFARSTGIQFTTRTVSEEDVPKLSLLRRQMG